MADYQKTANYGDMKKFQDRYRMRPDFCYGFPSLDKLTNGLHEGELIVLGGRIAEGKTSVAVQIAGGVARAGHKVVFFSNEMPREALWAKLAAHPSGCSVEHIMNGDMDEYIKTRVLVEFEKMQQWPLLIYDKQEGADATRVKAVVDEFNPALIVIDHLQMTDSIDSYEREIDILKRSMHEYRKLSVKTGCCIILLSQLNRDIENRKSIMPKLKDLMGSSKIEAIADRVILCCYPNKVLQDLDDEKERKFQDTDYFLLLAKNRYGKVGKVKLDYLSEVCYFREQI